MPMTVADLAGLALYFVGGIAIARVLGMPGEESVALSLITTGLTGLYIAVTNENDTPAGGNWRH